MINNKAYIYSAQKPSEEQEQRFLAFLRKKYQRKMSLEWVDEPSLDHGFRLEVGNDVYDWSPYGLLTQLNLAIDRRQYASRNIIPILKKTLTSFELSTLPEERGKVRAVGDGIARIDGLSDASYGEILLFDNGARGMVLNLLENEVGCVLFDDDDQIHAGSTVRRTGKNAGIMAGEELLGRVISPLGVPIDGKGEIHATQYMPIEQAAPGIIDRSPVDTPLATGILSIDSMFPIGRGQRELIIGDRQTGKTAIAADTILNQKGKDCICIYVAIGQKASSVAQLVETFRKHEATDYTVVVAATASDSDPLLYIAPYAGCAIAEYFMEQGRDVLIVYDDLSKHAVAYRAISLLLGRPPGREAYPGDVFYLHSRLLERSARMSQDKGGGSITALPIVETQAGDVSAYVPTNIISITDGQIFLESSLFFAGQRPAVNVGLSVSRVGGSAQTKAMKKAAGSLRIDLAQFREMEVFTQFASDLDDSTRAQLSYGQGLMRMLRQDQSHPYAYTDMVVMLVAALTHTIEGIAQDEVNAFLCQAVKDVKESLSDVYSRIDSSKVLSDEDRDAIIECARNTREQWIARQNAESK